MTQDRRKTVASIVILVVLGLHLIPLVSRAERDTLWPFMIWAMYKNSRPAGPVVVNQRHLVAATASGAQDTITPELLGLSITVLDWRFQGPLMRGDTSVVPGLFERLNRGRDEPYVEVRVVSETYTVTDTGLARRKNPVVTYRASEVEH